MKESLPARYTQLLLRMRRLDCSTDRATSEPARPVSLSDSLRIVAGAARRPALFPQLFPIPDPVRHLVRQRESELMREHTYLPAMVGFVGKHVAQHFHADRPGQSPTVSAKLLDAAPHNRRALQRASPRSERRSRPIPRGPAAA